MNKIDKKKEEQREFDQSVDELFEMLDELYTESKGLEFIIGSTYERDE